MKKQKKPFLIKNPKKILIFCLTASIALATFVVSEIVENSKDYVGKKATNFVISKLGGDNELLDQSVAIDCYNAIYGDLISEGLTQIKNEVIENNNIIVPQVEDSVTLEEVIHSIKSIGIAVEYSNNIEHTEEEMTALRNLMAHNYAVIMKYTSIHQDEDYSNFLVGTMSKMLDNLYQENNIDNIYINCIVPVNNETMAIEANVNGKVMNFTIQGKEYYDLISKVLMKNKPTFIDDLEYLNNALSGKMQINEDNQIVKKDEVDSGETMAIIMISAMCLYVAISSMSKQR